MPEKRLDMAASKQAIKKLKEKDVSKLSKARASINEERDRPLKMLEDAYDYVAEAFSDLFSSPIERAKKKKK